MAEVLVLNVNDDDVYIATCNELDDYYKHLDSDMFDIAQRKIGDKYYDIFVDDIGLFREKPIVSAVNTEDFSPMLVGNLIFANHDNEGNTTSLTEDDIKNIVSNLEIAVDEELNVRVVVKVSY